MNLPIFRISVQNALLMSAAYLSVATALEWIRRLFGAEWAEQACLAMERFPARALQVVGLLDFLKYWYQWGRLSQTEVRVIFGVTTVVMIFVVAMLVGAGMWALAKYTSKAEVG